MKTHVILSPSSRPAFALISVLALVSLAALTATAFLASARLERSATRPIGDITRLQMSLNTGKECATEVINRIGEPYWNFVTTYWRTNPADDIGYLFLGKMGSTNSLAWPYTCGFTPATWTNLDTNSVATYVTATNLICQASFSNDIAAFMTTATNGFSNNPSPTSRICTQIPMLGGRTSPPVGWVYIKQNIRTNPSSTNTTSLPVSRFAYFIEDLGGLIDAERMGGTNSRPSGTNAEEISLANLTGSSATNISPTVYASNRPQYLTPGMLMSANGGFLTNTNDLRYFASGLRYCNWSNQNLNWSRIPYFPISASAPYYPINAGYRKYPLTNLTLGGQSAIAATIITNFPRFSTRSGGMDTNLYINALAASIVDYADTDSSATVVSVTNASSTTSEAVGIDNYPMITHVYDKIVYTSGTNANLNIVTYLQLWNPANISTGILSGGTFSYSFNQQIKYTKTNDNTSITTNISSTPLANSNFTIPNTSFSPNQVYITSITNTIGLTVSSMFPNFPTNTNVITLTNNGTHNTFRLTIGGTTIKPAIGFFQSLNSATASQINITGSVLGLEQNFPNLKLWNADPRMLPYRGKGTAMSYADIPYVNTLWNSYPARITPVVSGNPSFWQDAGVPSTTTSLSTNYPATTPPSPGFFSNPDPSPYKISNFGSYTNICELGNIFDPIQWRSPTAALDTNLANTNITSTWTADSLYGGGSTLRIGRPEHSRFAFTNLGGTYPVPSLGTSAAGLLEIFCATNAYNWAGKININTAPLPVLAALAGGITLNTTSYSGGTAPTNVAMIRAFTNGVAKFRNTYPFITPSQLAFISSDYGTNTTFTNSWPTNAVFATNTPTGSLPGGLQGPTSMNDEGREEWFSKIYNLACVQSFNYRIYVVAQLTDTNGNPKGAMMRKYYQIYLNYNGPQPPTGAPDSQAPSVSPLPSYEAFY